jgi:hypothetical protein
MVLERLPQRHMVAANGAREKRHRKFRDVVDRGSRHL